MLKKYEIESRKSESRKSRKCVFPRFKTGLFHESRKSRKNDFRNSKIQHIENKDNIQTHLNLGNTGKMVLRNLKSSTNLGKIESRKLLLRDFFYYKFNNLNLAKIIYIKIYIFSLDPEYIYFNF